MAEDGQDDLALMESKAKTAVLLSTSSEADPILHRIEEAEPAPRKRLKTKRELDKIRRKSGYSDKMDGSETSDDEDFTRGMKRKATASPDSIRSDAGSRQQKKQRV